MARPWLMLGAMALFGVALASACGDDETTPPPAGPALPLPESLEKTLDDLADMGAKIAGTEAGAQAAEYIEGRFRALGIADVTFEPFDFPLFVPGSSTLEVLAEGEPIEMAHDVFYYSGAGEVTAEVVDAGLGHEEDYAGLDVAGKIVLVNRDPTFHRQSQLRLVVEHGGAAMLYVSASPDNLIQIGTVADPEDGLAEAPAVTVGADDGEAILAAIEVGMAVTATIGVDASIEQATGRNVVARVPGTDPSGAYILVGAHFDSWYVGATDNGTGVAALLELADRVVRGPARRLGVVFVAYDGEELGLFGGYDYLRKHVIVEQEPMLAFVNLEMPAAGPEGSGIRGLAHTNEGPIDPALQEASLDDLYLLYVGMEVVPAQFGGLIPTDIQGMYWHGLHGFTTYCDTAYYHTPQDTPDKIDVPFLAEVVLGLEQSLVALDDDPIMSFDAQDPTLWYPDVETAEQPNGDLEVTVVAKDAGGTVYADATVSAWVDVDDFTRVARETATTDASGQAVITIPAAALAAGDGSRWLHVTAGMTYPLHEHIEPL